MTTCQSRNLECPCAEHGRWRTAAATAILASSILAAAVELDDLTAHDKRTGEHGLCEHGLCRAPGRDPETGERIVR